MVDVAVMGAGSWGTVLAKVFADAGNPVTLWARRAELAASINNDHVNTDYLPELTLPANIAATTDAEEALSSQDIVVLAVPSQRLRSNLEHWADVVPARATILSLAKGIEQDSLMRMSQIIEEVGHVDADRIAVLSGPNLAHEVGQEQPAATVIACKNENRAKLIQSALATNYFRPYTNTDVIGCEIGGATKNVIALACGMSTGKGLGANTLGTLITRGLAETSRLGDALGANPRTFAGLAGMGDLVATCTSELSRNRTFGYRLGKGETMKQAQEATHGQVAEGVVSSESIHRLAQAHKVEMPITQAVNAVCHQGMKVDEMVTTLMGRSRKPE